jgi:tRNA G26 N,N-dimethylase Trm1
VSRVTPKEFEETYIRVYCRYKAQQDEVKEVFQQVMHLHWC